MVIRGNTQRAEAGKAWELYQSGVLREPYFTTDTDEAVLFWNVVALYEARAILKGLPLVKAGLIDFEVTPLLPYPGFARVFERKPQIGFGFGCFGRTSCKSRPHWGMLRVRKVTSEELGSALRTPSGNPLSQKSRRIHP
jgi:hypothetical protein